MDSSPFCFSRTYKCSAAKGLGWLSLRVSTFLSDGAAIFSTPELLRVLDSRVRIATFTSLGLHTAPKGTQGWKETSLQKFYNLQK